MSKSRAEAFSDGVFSITFTLLILEIHVRDVPDVTDARLGAALLPMWPQVLTYVPVS